MSIYIVGVVVALAVLAVPPIRQAVLSLIGLLAVAVVAVAGIGLPVWALYEAKPWLVSALPAVVAPPPQAAVDGAAKGERERDEKALAAAQEAERQRIEEERQRQAAAQRKAEEAKLRRTAAAETARSVVDRERTYASLAASSSRLRGLDQVSIDLLAIRIPSWRDGQLSEREQGLIRVWLESIGLTPDETAEIHTANGWGTVYDLWIQDKAAVAEEDPLQPRVAVRAAPEPIPDQDPEPEPEPEPEVESEPEPEWQRVDPAPYPPPRAGVPAFRPRSRAVAPRSPEPRTRSAPQERVGPFGY
jgi:hypothetical protein